MKLTTTLDGHALRRITSIFIEYGESQRLREHLMFYKHDVQSTNYLQQISTDDISQHIADGDLIETVITPIPVKNIATSPNRPHILAEHTFKGRVPTFCNLCGELFHGILKQGLKCQACRANFHKKCASQIKANCTATQNVSFKGSEASGACNCNCHNLTQAISIPSTIDSGMDSNSTITENMDVDNENEQRSNRRFATSQSNKFSAARDSLNNKSVKRIYESRRESKREKDESIQSGWLMHHTDSTTLFGKQRFYWRLDAKSLVLHNDEHTRRFHKEILLSEILSVSISPEGESGVGSASGSQSVRQGVASRAKTGTDDVGRRNAKSIHGGTTSKVTIGDSEEDLRRAQIVIITANATYFLSSASRQWRADILTWYKAISAALMPVTVTPQEDIKEENIYEKIETESQLGIGSLGIELISDQQFSQMYQIFPEDTLGAGQFGTVYGSAVRETGKIVAIKVIDKARFPTYQEDALRTEVNILQKLHHSGIVEFRTIIDTPERIYVVMEKMHGDMLDLILHSEMKRLSERLSAFLIYQIANALLYLHSQNIVHCDLKPENVLVASDSEFPQVKLCDFGFARIIGEKSFRRSIVGTPAYLAPEVIKQKGFNRAIDMWSLGVVAYVSLSGEFAYREDGDIEEQVQNTDHLFPQEPWEDVSMCARDFIENLLKVSIQSRPTALKTMSHLWLQGYQLWVDLRKLEKELCERYLTNPAMDPRWAKYEADHNINRQY